MLLMSGCCWCCSDVFWWSTMLLWHHFAGVRRGVQSLLIVELILDKMLFVVINGIHFFPAQSFLTFTIVMITSLNLNHSSRHWIIQPEQTRTVLKSLEHEHTAQNHIEHSGTPFAFRNFANLLIVIKTRSTSITCEPLAHTIPIYECTDVCTQTLYIILIIRVEVIYYVHSIRMASSQYFYGNQLKCISRNHFSPYPPSTHFDNTPLGIMLICSAKCNIARVAFRTPAHISHIPLKLQRHRRRRIGY